MRERAATFVGRDAERAFLRRVLDDDGPIVAFVHGLAGVGKSSLLRVFAAEAPVVLVDGDAVEPTEAGFRRALDGDIYPRAARRVVLAIDAYERLGLLDDWLRRAFVPSLPGHVRVVIAGRDAPVAAWHRAYGPLLNVLELDSLPPADALELLVRLGVPEARAEPVNRVLRGHPLSLLLAASSPGGAAIHPALDELARTYLAGLSPATRSALDAASVVRRVTSGLLDAMLDDGAGALARLRELPFVTIGEDGLAVHHVLREAVATELAATDRVRHRRLRAAAWRRLRDELAAAGDADLWRYTADMLYLLERPAIRDAFFPPSAPRYAVEPARPEDAAAIAAIADRHEPPAGAALQRAWWDAAPGAFYVARDAGGGVAGFSAVCEPGDVSPRLIDADPIAAAWRAHLRTEPLVRGQRALFIRFMCGAESGEQPAPDVAPLFLDLKRSYLTLRPALRRLYTCAHDPAMPPTLEPLGFVVLEAQPVLDGVAYRCYCNDLGAGSVDGWLARLAARDVLAGNEPVLDPEQRRLLLDGAAVDLTPLEFRVLQALHERAGAVVRRDALVTEVWGAGWDGDGNALESAVSGVRRKLGSRAGALETVRGVGYRLRPWA
jgi:hypothetical protein